MHNRLIASVSCRHCSGKDGGQHRSDAQQRHRVHLRGALPKGKPHLLSSPPHSHLSLCFAHLTSTPTYHIPGCTMRCPSSHPRSPWLLVKRTFKSGKWIKGRGPSAAILVQIYLQRLGVDLGDGDAVRRAAGCAFALATQALAELPILHFPPSLTAAAVLVAARKAQVPTTGHRAGLSACVHHIHRASGGLVRTENGPLRRSRAGCCAAQGSVPFWPSVLSQLTGYTEASTPAFASAIGHAERLCTKLCNEPPGAFGGGGPLLGSGLAA